MNAALSEIQRSAFAGSRCVWSSMAITRRLGARVRRYSKPSRVRTNSLPLRGWIVPDSTARVGRPKRGGYAA
jgi:hypothetical protein